MMGRYPSFTRLHRVASDTRVRKRDSTTGIYIVVGVAVGVVGMTRHLQGQYRTYVNSSKHFNMQNNVTDHKNLLNNYSQRRLITFFKATNTQL